MKSPVWSGDFAQFEAQKLAPIACLQVQLQQGSGGRHLAPAVLASFDRLTEQGKERPEGVHIVAVHQFDTLPLKLELQALRPKLPVYESYRYGLS